MQCAQCRVWRVWMRRITQLVSCCSSRASARSGSFICPTCSEMFRQVQSKAPAEITPQLHWYSHKLSISPFVSFVQVNLCYLCQTCTYLLHSKKMLHHYLQVSYSYVSITTRHLADTRKKLLNNDFMFVLDFLRLKMVRRYPLLLYQRHSGRPKLHLKRRQVEGRERKLSRRPYWLCSAVFWRFSVKPSRLCSTSPQTAVRFFLTRSAHLLWPNQPFCL